MSGGFGQSQEISTKREKKLVLMFARQIGTKERDPEQTEQFFAKREIEINEKLLENLPTLFRRLTQDSPGKRQHFAAVLVDFGSALYHVPVGDRQLNVEIFLRCCQLALKAFSQKRDDQNWAMTQNNLGVAYCNRIRGERADNLEQAIAAYERALEVYTREAFPQDWAMTQNNLAAAYRVRIRGERADNLEQAIAAFQQALEVRTRDAFPEYWADTQNNLGLAYCDRIREERADNLEQAIAAYEQALEVYTRDAFPEDWAITQHNLADAYYECSKSDGDEYLNLAIATYQKASEIFTCEDFPQKWVRNQSHLAEAFISRYVLPGHDTDLDEAIALLQAALTVATHRSTDFIDAQYTLGQALTQRYDRDKNPDDLAAAERAYATALECIDPEHYDIEKYRNALPAIQAVMGSRLVRDGRWKEGLDLLLESLTKLQNANDPQAHANALYQTALAYEYEDNLPKARTYYRDALRLYASLDDPLGQAQSYYGLGNVLVNQGFPEKGKEELETARDLYQTLAKQDKIEEIDRLIASVCRTIERLDAPLDFDRP
jgi:tetratricopeptide (TPR) repeat protein